MDAFRLHLAPAALFAAAAAAAAAAAERWVCRMQTAWDTPQMGRFLFAKRLQGHHQRPGYTAAPLGHLCMSVRRTHRSGAS